MKIYKKIIFILAFALLLMLVKSGKVNAASAFISCPPVATQNQSMNVIVSGTAAQWNLSLKANGATIASSSELDSISNKTISFAGTYTPSSAGTVTFTLEGTATDENGETIRSFGSKSVSVSASSSGTSGSTTTTAEKNTGTPSTTSSDEPKLTNLGINPHDFSGFRSANTSYSVNVPNDCSSIEIYATGNGSISGTGTKTLKEGTNKFSITVSLNGNSKTYTLSINRATIDGEDVPNVTEEEEKQEDENKDEGGIGLEGLEVTGFVLSPKFDKKVKEYTVKVDKKFTSLDEIKKLIVAKFTDENYKVEVTTEASLKDDKNVVTIIIKDDEKEYSRYTVTFVYEQKEEKIKAPEKVEKNDNKDDSFKLLGYTFDKQMIPVFVITGCALFAVALAMFLAIKLFIKSKKLRKYEDEYDDYDDYNDNDRNENDEVEEDEEKNDSEIDNPYKYSYEEKVEQDEPKDETEEENTDEDEDEYESDRRYAKKPGFRSVRKGKRTGRHF